MPAEVLTFRPRVHLKKVGVPQWRREEFERDVEGESFDSRLPWDKLAKEWLDENVEAWRIRVRRSEDLVRTVPVGVSAQQGERVSFAQYDVEIELPDPDAARRFRAWQDEAASCKNC